MERERPPEVTITLSPVQVREVLHAARAGRAPGLVSLLARGAAGARELAAASPDPSLSRSLLRGLSILALLGSPPAERGIVEIAEELAMSASTAHRYAHTLLELGLVERCPETRRYRLSLPRLR